MSRKILSVLLAVFLAVGFASFMTKADVTGSFTANITVNPIDCGALPFVTIAGTGQKGVPILCENTLQKIDFETILIVNWTVSGLTLGFNTAAGFTGIEHILTSLKATLGALNITDQFFFAVPFGTDTLVIHNATSTQTDSELAWTVISNNLLFVKKRVSVSISIAGITLSNLAEIGDFTFPGAGLHTTYPCAESNGGKCPLLPAQSKYPNGYTAASQNFAFGDMLTVSGQTVSGITVTNIAFFDIDPNRFEGFKKISFQGVLCKGAGEKIVIAGIPVAKGITAKEDLCFNLIQAGLTEPTALPNCFRAAAPFTARTTLNITTGFGNFLVTLKSSLPTSAFISGAQVTFSSGPLTVTQEFDANLVPLVATATLSFTLNPDSNPAGVTLTAILCQEAGVGPFSGFTCTGAGLAELDTSLSVQRSGVTLQVNASMTGMGTVTLSSLEFVVSGQGGPVTMGADLFVVPTFSGSFNFGVNF